LLAKALLQSERCAIGHWAARGKSYIVMIRPVANGLVMQQLLYSDEVRSINEIDIPKIEVKETELKLAHKLIDQQSSEKFNPADYKDEVRERIEKAIEKKEEGQEITLADAPTGEAKVVDLMEALRASLERTGERKPAKRAEVTELSSRRKKKS